MRKLVYFMMMSLDGFIADERQSLDWVLIDEEIHRFANQLEREVGLELYGRRMYEVMDSFWPTADTDPNSQDFIIEFSRL
jgi:dihydrofolate reductase